MALGIGDAASGDDPTQAATRELVDRNPDDELPRGARRYVLGRRLGRGGMGEVVEAEDLQFGRTVAVKRLLAGGREGSELRFAAEAQITGALAHAGIPSVYERGRFADGTPYYSMQKIEGRTLTEMLRECDSTQQRLRLLPAVVRVAQTLAFAHERGVIHRDLKPDNIIIDDYGQVVVLDWGLAKAPRSVPHRAGGRVSRSAGDDLTLDGAVMGTPAYMAPEQAAGRVDSMDARTDVFGVGAILFQVLTGVPPYKASTSAEAIAKASAAEHPAIASLTPEIPQRLSAICERALSRSPGDRQANAAEFAAQLDEYAADAVANTTERVADWVSSAIGVVSVLAVILMIALISIGSGLVSQLGPIGVFFMVLALLGCLSSGTEWLTRGRYRLAPLALAMAAATGALGVGSWAIGMAETHGRLAGNATDRLEVLDASSALALLSLALASFLCALQLLAWGVARRRTPKAPPRDRLRSASVLSR